MLFKTKQRTQLRAIIGGIFLSSMAVLPAHAVDFTYNGFATIGMGKTFSGVSEPYLGFDCPCYVANYLDVGVYGNKWAFKPDTKIGLQGTAKISKDLSFTGQVIMPAANDFKPRVDWAYASYNVNDSLTIQAGRKRLPLFAYSDSFDIGFSYPWVRPHGDLYGWQIVAYNGVNAMYKTSIKDIDVTANIWTGMETDKDNRMMNKIYYGDRVDERWTNIIGGYLDLDMDIVSVRAVAMTNKVDRWVGEGASRVVNKEGVKQNFFGLSANMDYNNIVVRTEMNRFVRPSVKDYYSIYLAGVGYRMGNFLPMVTYAKFKEDFKTSPLENEIHNTTSFSVRWDVAPSTALKLQYDNFKDKSAFDYVGNSKTIAISLDKVF